MYADDADSPAYRAYFESIGLGDGTPREVHLAIDWAEATMTAAELARVREAAQSPDCFRRHFALVRLVKAYREDQEVRRLIQ